MEPSSLNPQAPKQPNLILAVFIVIQIVLAILLAVSIPRLFFVERISENDIVRQPQVSVDDIAENIPDLYSNNISHIQRVLFDVIKETRPEVNTTLTASLRTDTVKTSTFKRNNTDYFTAIIDVPEINQAYQVFYGHSNTENEAPNDFIAILCAPDAIDCKDSESQPSRYEIVARYLKYFDFNYFSTLYKNDDLTKIFINPTEYDVAKSDQESYLRTIKEAIETLGVSPDLFTYEFIQPSDVNYHITSVK